MPTKTTNRAKGGLRKAALPVCLAVFVGGCVDGDPSVPRKGSMCRTYSGDGLWGGGSEAAMDEGAGVVSYQSYSFADNMGSGATLNLVTCASGRQLSIGRNDYFIEEDAIKKRAASLPDWAAIQSPDDFFVRLRKVVDVQDEKALRPLQRRYGFELETAQLNADSDMAICACKLYYPKATGDWATTKMTDAAASN